MCKQDYGNPRARPPSAPDTALVHFKSGKDPDLAECYHLTVTKLLEYWHTAHFHSVRV